MPASSGWLARQLGKRETDGMLRSLAEPYSADHIDFYSNDYLGLARKPLVFDASTNLGHRIGSSGSRLLSGNSADIEACETSIAQFHGFEAGLLFPSGYIANVGLLSCIAKRGDILLLDEYCHASLIDGAQLSFAKRRRFKHNDMADLEEKLRSISDGKAGHSGNVFVVTEAIFSMDGDCAPLQELADLCDRYSVHLIVDEAHSIGVIGVRGEGLVASLGLQEKVFACVYTFGKAPGLHGAVIAGDQVLKQFLINFCRPFIYSTGPTPAAVQEISLAHQRMIGAEVERKQLSQNIGYFTEAVVKNTSLRPHFLVSETAIQAMIVPGNHVAKKLETELRNAGVLAKAILSPTVAKGSERIRFCLHAFNTKNEIDVTLKTCANFVQTQSSIASINPGRVLP